MSWNTHIPKFRRFVLQNFPFIEEDFDALTDYALICKVVEYLNNVITSQNLLISEVESFETAMTTDFNNLSDAFDQLQSFVDHYFDNLDVQQEINNKLDGLVADGTLEMLIGAYIQPRIDAQNQRITTLYESVDSFESTINAQVLGFSDMVDSIVSGSPLVASSTAGMTNTNRVYVNTTDGKWYYYNGTDWVAGGTYQSSGISAGTITLTMFGSDVKYNIKTRYNGDKARCNGTIELDLTNNLVNKAVAGGELGVDSDTRVASVNLIYVPNGYAVECISDDSGAYKVTEYDFDENMTNSSYNIDLDSSATYAPIVNGNRARYIRLRFSKADNSTLTPSDVVSDVVVGLVQRIPNYTNTTVGTNLANPYTAVHGYIQDGATPYRIVKSASYNTFMPIKMVKGTTYQISAFRKLLMYDKDLEYVANSYVDGNNSSTSFTASFNGYFMVSARTIDNVMINTGDELLSYDPYVEVLPPYVQIQNVENLRNITVTGNDILSNKTYVALGDSFTHGDFSHAPEDNYHITSGKYSGQLKVYPYIIGNRLNMQISNLAQNGMTMCKINDEWTNYISDAVLSSIPENPDYITIKIGINDNPDHRNSPLGTIDDSTNTTFYGSYNHVMNYLITNFPNAKIGIIISNGQTSMDFINAEIAIAKKFGVPYLNETTDDHVPLLIRTMRTDVSDEIKELRLQNWSVKYETPNANRHPSAECHEYESTIVENFLRSL